MNQFIRGVSDNKVQEFIAQPVTKVVSGDKTYAIRRCINCGQDDSQNLFSFTYDFLVNVRNVPLQDLESIGWKKNTTSTLVKCKRCGCNYIRDVYIADEDKTGQKIARRQVEEALSKYSKSFAFDSITHLQYCREVIAVLLRYLALTTDKKEISLLDFGSSLSILSPMARLNGFNTVVSYDPKFRLNFLAELNGLFEYHPLRINYVKTKEDMRRFAPFDAIVCQSAIEHFYDPQSEIKLMHDLLADDGILFINCPYMPLDKELSLLKNESQISDKLVLKRIRKSYHIDHLNCIMARDFAWMLRGNRLKEKKIFFHYPADLHTSRFALKNLIGLTKDCARYVLDLLDIKYKKVNFFVIKR